HDDLERRQAVIRAGAQRLANFREERRGHIEALRVVVDDGFAAAAVDTQLFDQYVVDLAGGQTAAGRIGQLILAFLQLLADDFLDFRNAQAAVDKQERARDARPFLDSFGEAEDVEGELQSAALLIAEIRYLVKRPNGILSGQVRGAGAGGDVAAVLPH